MFGLDVTVWSPPHLFAVGAAGAIRLGGVVALAGEMSHAGPAMPPRQRSWNAMSLAEGVLLVPFSLLLGNLTFVLGGYEYWATPQEGVAYMVMASLVVPVVLVAGVHRLRRVGTATSIVLLLLLWQELMRVALFLTKFVLPSFLPLWPLYVVPAAAVDIWYGLVHRCPQAVWNDAVAGLLFAGLFVGLVYGESGASTGVFWSPDVLPLNTLPAGVTGVVSEWAGPLLARRLLAPGASAGRRWTRAPTGAAP